MFTVLICAEGAAEAPPPWASTYFWDGAALVCCGRRFSAEVPAIFWWSCRFEFAAPRALLPLLWFESYWFYDVYECWFLTCPPVLG